MTVATAGTDSAWSGYPKSVVDIVGLSYPPDFGGGATRAEALARLLKGLGFRITVLATYPSYPRVPSPNPHETDTASQDDGIEVIRTPPSPFPYMGVWRRLFNYVLFSLTLFSHRSALRSANVVLVVGPHPMVSLVTFLLVGNKVLRLLDISDLLPEGYGPEGSLRNRALVAIGRGFRKLICSMSDGVLVSNGFIAHYLGLLTDRPVLELHTPLDASMSRPPDNGPNGVGIHRLLYHGTFGPLQGLERLLNCAQAIRDLPNLKLYLVGEGEAKARLARLREVQGLRNVDLVGPMSRAEIDPLVDDCLAGLVPLARAHPLVLSYAVPTKFYEFLRHGKPVLCEAGGEMARLVLRYRCGIPVNFSRPLEFRRAVEELMSPDRYAAYASGAANAYRELIAPESAMSRLAEFLQRLQSLRKSPSLGG